MADEALSVLLRAIALGVVSGLLAWLAVSLIALLPRKSKPATKPSRLVALPVSGDVIERDSIVGIVVHPPQRVQHPEGGKAIFTRARVLVGSSRYGSAFVIECDDLETAEGVREIIKRMAQGEDPPPAPDMRHALQRIAARTRSYND